MEEAVAYNLEEELQALIIEVCNIPDPPSSIDPDAPLIGPDSVLGLDSLDAVEVVVAIQKQYGIRIGGNDTSRHVLRTLRTLAEFIRG